MSYHMTDDNQAGVTPAEEPLAVLIGLETAWNTGNLDGVLSYFSPTATITFMPPPPPPDEASYQGRQAIQRLVRSYLAEDARMVLGDVEVYQQRLVGQLWLAADRYRRMEIESLEATIEAHVEQGQLQSLTLRFTTETVLQIEAALAKAVVLQLYAAWNSQDYARALDLLGHTSLSYPTQPAELSLQPAAAGHPPLSIAFPQAQFNVDLLIAEGSKVVSRFTFEGRQQGQLAGLPPSGRSVSVQGIDIWNVVDGVIVHHWGQLDTVSLLEQLGF